MLLIPQKRIWTQQPQQAIDVAAEFRDSLLGVFNAGAPTLDWSYTGATHGFEATNFGGLAYETNSNSTYASKVVSGNQSTGFTILYSGKVRTVAASQDHAGLYSGTTYRSLIYTTSTGSLSFFYKNGGAIDVATGLAAGTRFVICATANGARYSVFALVDGEKFNVSGAYTGTGIYNTIHCGARFAAGGRVSSKLASFWNRALPDELSEAVCDNEWRLFDAPDARIWVPVSAAGGAASVSADSQVSYSMRGTAAADSSPAYAIRSAVSATDAEAFNTRSAANATSSPAYNVRGATQADSAPTYAVRNAAQSELSSTFLTRVAVAAEVSTLYDIQSSASVAATVATSYGIMGLVSGSSAPAYSVRGATSQEAPASFSVRGLVSADCASAYALAAAEYPVYADIETSYTVFGVIPPAPTAEQIADAVWSRLLESGLTAAQMQRITLAALVGKTVGLGSTTEQYLAQDGSTPRIVVAFDGNSNRTSVTLDGG